ncbi:hypothetical protein DMX02_17300 [Pseudomonas jessenii]|nr:hypothetical protein DMX02_17300 [Pseudomonas jessenii]
MSDFADRWFGCTGPFASKLAPTVDRVLSQKRVRLWERACSRRGHQNHHKIQSGNCSTTIPNRR